MRAGSSSNGVSMGMAMAGVSATATPVAAPEQQTSPGSSNAGGFTDFVVGTEEETREVTGKEDTFEYLRVLLNSEEGVYPLCKDYLSDVGDNASSNNAGSSDASSTSSDRVSEAWRRKLCEWCFEVVDHFQVCYYIMIACLLGFIIIYWHRL